MSNNFDGDAHNGYRIRKMKVWQIYLSTHRQTNRPISIYLLYPRNALRGGDTDFVINLVNILSPGPLAI